MVREASATPSSIQPGRIRPTPCFRASVAVALKSGRSSSFRLNYWELNSGEPKGSPIFCECRVLVGSQSGLRLQSRHTQQLTHLFVKETTSRPVRLNPFAVDHELGNGSLANVLDYVVGCPGRFFDVDLLKGNVVFDQECFGFAA